MTGIAFNMNANAIVHAASTPVTAHHGVPHGVANAIFLPPGLDLIRPACEDEAAARSPRRLARTSRGSAGRAGRRRGVEAVRALLQRLRSCRRRCAPGVSIPRNMDIPQLVEDAMKSRNIATNPWPIGPPELAELYQAAQG